MLDGWQEWAKQRGARGLAYVLVGSDGELGGPVAKNLSEAERAGLAAAVGAVAGGLRVLRRRRPRGRAVSARRGPGRDRAPRGLVDEGAWSFVWVVDAPMFEWSEEVGGWTAVHHPFTGPTAEWADRFDAAPGEALAYAYDIVCNGNEIGGGSIRIHRGDIQQPGLRRPGHLPGGCAGQVRFPVGRVRFRAAAARWHRVRLGPVVMLLAGAESLREVIAFPKTGAGFDPLTGAPTPITPAQRKEAGIDAVPDPPTRHVCQQPHSPVVIMQSVITDGSSAPPEP